MEYPDHNSHPSDQIIQIKGLAACLYLAVTGLDALRTIPTSHEISGILEAISQIDQRLDELNNYLEKENNPADSPAA